MKLNKETLKQIVKQAMVQVLVQMVSGRVNVKTKIPQQGKVNEKIKRVSNLIGSKDTSKLEILNQQNPFGQWDNVCSKTENIQGSGSSSEDNYGFSVSGGHDQNIDLLKKIIEKD